MLNLLRSIFYAMRQRIRSGETPDSPVASGLSSVRSAVLVGHCGPDMFMLRTAVSRALPGVSIVSVNDTVALRDYLTPDSLLLVNRELDGRFDSQSGIDLISQITNQDSPPVAILISDFEDAQSQAVAAGAEPGFGKSQLYDSSTMDILNGAMNPR